MTDSPVDSADSDVQTLTGLLRGDPIDERATYDPGVFTEWQDAVILNDEFGLVVGQGSNAVVSMDDATILTRWDADSGLRVALDGDTAWVATRFGGIYSLDMSDPLAPTRGLYTTPVSGYHEDIAADSGRVLLAAQEHGALLMEGAQVRAVLPADFAYGVGLLGDRGVVADANHVTLWDLSDTDQPLMLDQQPLPGTGREVAFDGRHVAVAMGGRGTLVFAVQGDRLVQRGQLITPGAAFSLALDGDWLWIAAWEVTALVWLGGEEPVVVGHQSPHLAAMGLDARGGRALVAGWSHSTVLTSNYDSAGPELHLPEQLWFDMDEPDTQTMNVRNWGAEPLELSFEAPDWVQVDPTALELAPGAAQQVTLHNNEGGRLADLRWWSSDPDESEGLLRMHPADRTVGLPHPDFERPGFIYPSQELSPYRLSEQRGQPVLLVYFSFG